MWMTQRIANFCTVLLLCFLITTGTSFGATLTVTNTDDAGPGSLRQAVADASIDDVIIFDGLLAGRTILLTNDNIIINKSLTIQGLGMNNLTVAMDDGIIDTNIFHIDNRNDNVNSNVVINDLTITGGDPRTINTAIFNFEDLTLNRVSISDYTGRAILSSSSKSVPGNTLTINDSIISRSLSASLSADIEVDRLGDIGGTLILNNSQLIGNNQVDVGIDNSALVEIAGIPNTIVINNSTITGYTETCVLNGARGLGDEIFGVPALNGEVFINNSTITDCGTAVLNHGVAAVVDTPGKTTIINSTISNNTVGIRNHGGNEDRGVGEVTIVSSTITGNDTGIIGGAPGNFEVDDLPGVINIKNSIVSSSVTSDCDSSGDYNGTDNLETDGTCVAQAGPIFTQVTPGQINLGPLQNNGGPTETHTLISPSVAINRVTDCTDFEGAAITEDQRGELRPFGPACDIGAFESDSLQPPLPLLLLLNTISPGIASNINEISAENATPDGGLAFLWGFAPGSVTVGGSRCNGLVIDLKRPRILRIVGASSDGDASHIFFIPQIGDSIPILTQAVDIDTCAKSGVVSNIIQNG